MQDKFCRPGDNPKGMHIITMWQPWASFVLYGWKKIETRTHNRFATLSSTRIGIHAGLHFDQDWKMAVRKHLSYDRLEIMMNMMDNIKEAKGNILCTAYVSDVGLLNRTHSKSALIDCSRYNRYGLVLRDIIELTPPIPATGKQGIWIYK